VIEKGANSAARLYYATSTFSKQNEPIEWHVAPYQAVDSIQSTLLDSLVPAGAVAILHTGRLWYHRSIHRRGTVTTAGYSSCGNYPSPDSGADQSAAN
jgi:hypothetical protein